MPRIDNPVTDHDQLGGVSTSQHHVATAQQTLHANLVDVASDQHHARQHALNAGADHTGGITDVQHGFITLVNAHAHGDLSGRTTDSHHALQHAIDSGAVHTGVITDTQHGVRTLADAHAHSAMSGQAPNDHHEPIVRTVDSGQSLNAEAPGWGWQSTANVAPGVNVVAYMPIYIPQTITYTRIGVFVSTLQAAETMRLAIYDAVVQSNNSIRPGALRLDAGTISTASTGQKEITISHELPPGYYFLSLVAAHATPAVKGILATTIMVCPVSGFGASGEFGDRICPSVVDTAAHAAAQDPAKAPDTVHSADWAFVRLRVA